MTMGGQWTVWIAESFNLPATHRGEKAGLGPLRSPKDGKSRFFVPGGAEGVVDVATAISVYRSYRRRSRLWAVFILSRCRPMHTAPMMR